MLGINPSLVRLIPFLFLILFPLQTLSQAPKIGIFDLQRIIRESKTIENYRQILLRKLEEKRRPIIEKENSLRELENRLRQEKLSYAERRELEDRIFNESRELRRMREDLEIELRRMDVELTQKAMAEIASIVKEIAEKEGFSIIFERNAAGVAYVKDGIDITSKILLRLK
ncbi:MAG: OmpH family outer membrane protein [Deltaproteobacteria bacterium]|nr:OmpH family outer membrane protein [Deltaproteobacteria bacterium]